MAVYEIPPVGPGWQLQAIVARYRFSVGIEREVVAILEDAYRQLAERLRVSKVLTRRDRNALEDRFLEVRTLLNEAYGTAQAKVTPTLREYAALEREVAARQLQALAAVQRSSAAGALATTTTEIAATVGAAPGGVTAVISGVPRTLVVSAARLTDVVESIDIGGIGFGDWWGKARDDGIARVRRTIQSGVVQGQHPSEIARRIWATRTAGGPNAWRQSRTVAQTAARTVVTALQTDAQLAAESQFPQVIRGYVFRAVLDARTSDVCRPLADTEWKAGDPRMPVPPLHPNCFPGDARVTASPYVAGATARPYNGELIVIRTADERVLRCTPNHPILTLAGWLAAKDLRVGDDVLGHRVDERVAHGGIDDDAKNTPPRIDQIAKLLTALPGVVRREVPVAAPDFHGDVTREGEIAVVVHDGGLIADRFSPRGQHGADRAFRLAGVLPLHFIRESTSALLMSVHRAPANSIVRRLRQVRSLLRCGARHASKLLLRSITKGSDTRDQAKLDRADRVVQPFRDAAYANALAIHDLRAVRISRIEVSHFDGHVYNLETSEGWYAVSGIITHNCRSHLEPIVDVPGIARTQSQQPTYEQWLRTQPANVQDLIVGKGIGAHLREGKATLGDLLTADRRPMTLAQLRDTLFTAHPESYVAWIESLPDASQRAVLGPALARQVRTGGARVADILRESAARGVVTARP